MNKLYNFESCEDLMLNISGVSDPSIEQFVSGLEKIRDYYLFAYLCVDVREVMVGEYFRENLCNSNRDQLPIVLIHENSDGIGDRVIRTLNEIEDVSLTLLMRHDKLSIGPSFFVDRTLGKFYFSSNEGDFIKVTELSGISSPIDIINLYVNGDKNCAITYIGSDSTIRDIRDSLLGVCEGDLEVSAVGDEMPLVLSYGEDFEGEVTTMFTAGFSEIETEFSYGNKPVGFELVAGYGNELGISKDWFYEIVATLYTNKISLQSDVVFENVSELKKLNSEIAGVLFATYDAWDKLKPVVTEDKHIDWFWVIPITVGELKIIKEEGVQELFDVWDKRAPDVFDLKRRHKRFKFF